MVRSFFLVFNQIITNVRNFKRLETRYFSRVFNILTRLVNKKPAKVRGPASATCFAKATQVKEGYGWKVRGRVGDGVMGRIIWSFNCHSIVIQLSFGCVQ